MTKELRVIVVDDSVLLREGLVRLIEEAGHRVVGSAGSCAEPRPTSSSWTCGCRRRSATRA
jgi:chemotaxis response regulator CheB